MKCRQGKSLLSEVVKKENLLISCPQEQLRNLSLFFPRHYYIHVYTMPQGQSTDKVQMPIYPSPPSSNTNSGRLMRLHMYTGTVVLFVRKPDTRFELTFIQALWKNKTRQSNTKHAHTVYIHVHTVWEEEPKWHMYIHTYMCLWAQTASI